VLTSDDATGVDVRVQLAPGRYRVCAEIDQQSDALAIEGRVLDPWEIGMANVVGKQVAASRGASAAACR